MLHSSFKRSLLALCLLALLVPSVATAAPSDKQLQRQRGSVKYRDKAGVTHQVAAQLVVPDDAEAITERASAALLQLPDSSEVALGENTSVVVGAFNSASTLTPNKISINHGALKFAIRHPSGAKSNYNFTTPTSQIAVRGTEGYLVVGPDGTQVVCTKCEPGDVTVTVGGIVTALVSGQVFTALGSGATTTTSISSVSTLNSPAVNQFSNGLNPFGNGAASVDVTSSASGATASAASAAGAVGGASIGAIAGGAAAAAVGVSSLATSASTSATTTIALAPAALSFTTLQTSQTFTFTGAASATATSTNPSVATVSGPAGNTFTVTSVGPGTATIMVTSGSASASLQVSVTGTVIQPQRKQ